MSATPSRETLENHCQRLRQEWFNAEFLLLSQGYEGKANVDKVAGAVGPLYYCTVNIAGEPVKAMVDTGSSATILSWEVFQAIGRKNKVPVSALYISLKLLCVTTVRGLFWWEQWYTLRLSSMGRVLLSLFI